MDFAAVMLELEQLSSELMKKRYLSNGAREPLFGVATGAMKPLRKKIKINQMLAEELYASGNYDAMYFAGVIADPEAMTEADYERWMDAAYFYMISDYVIAVTLAESDLAQTLSDKWIESDQELRTSAGWSCYCWLLGSRPDQEFSKDKISEMLIRVENTIHEAAERTKASMSYFVYTVATSYLPLHEQALKTAETIGTVEARRDNKKPLILNAYEDIQNAAAKGRLGFKRRYVRC